MGYFEFYDVAPGSMDQELYERIYNRFVKKYPEAKEPGFTPTYSEHDSDWDTIWDEEELRYEQEKYHEGTSEKNQSVEGEYEDEAIYNPTPSKKKKKKKKTEESVEPIENCSSEENPHADKCNFSSFLCFMDDGSGTPEGNSEIKFYNDEGTRVFHDTIGIACNNHGSNVHTFQIHIINPKGPCSDHGDGRVFYAYGSNVKIVDQNDIQLTFEVFSNHKNDRDSLFPDLNLAHSREKCRVVMEQCGTREELLIEVVPNYQISLDLTIEFEDKKTKDVGWDRPKGKYNDGPPGKVPKIPADHTKVTPYKKKLNLIKEFNGFKQNWGAEFGESELANFDKLVTILDDCFVFVNAWFSTFAQLTVNMPKVKGEGKWSYLTTKDYKLKRTGKYSVTCDPLIGFTFDMSLIKSGIIGGPALGRALQLAAKVKEWTEGHINISFDITVSLGGSISMEFAQSFEEEKPMESKVVSSVGVKVKAFASFAVDAYIVAVKATGSASASATLTMSLEMVSLFLPKGDWKCDFGGLDLVLEAVWEVGIGWLSYGDAVNAKYTVVDKYNFWTVPFDFN